MKKGSFSCRKRATKGSSFLDLEKHLFERGLETESWKELLKIKKVATAKISIATFVLIKKTFIPFRSVPFRDRKTHWQVQLALPFLH
jgi:hypothetical protein